MRMLAALAVALALGAPSAALAQQAHSAEDEAACTPDVMRLCQEFIPNRKSIVACLVEKKKDLSPECNTVFSRPASSRAVEDSKRPARRKPIEHAPN